jgi:hypothetical protein
MLDEDLPFKVVRTNSHDEILAHAANLLVGWAAYETAIRLFLRDANRSGEAEIHGPCCLGSKGEKREWPLHVLRERPVPYCARSVT